MIGMGHDDDMWIVGLGITDERRGRYEKPFVNGRGLV